MVFYFCTFHFVKPCESNFELHYGNPMTQVNNRAVCDNGAKFCRVCDLRRRISFQTEVRDCSIIGLIKTWLLDAITDFAVEPSGFSNHHVDRDCNLTGKTKNVGLCSCSVTVGSKHCAS